MKTFIQKGFEKAVMLERNSDLSLALAKDVSGDGILVIGLGSMDDSFTPIAKLLTSNEIASMNPLVPDSRVIDEWFKRVRGTLEGKNSKDFEANTQHPELTQEAVDNHLTNNPID
tara:strand:- start:135 stop:479 length:345 start_codon:yes stop_codon:yes gene_type:complete